MHPEIHFLTYTFSSYKVAALFSAATGFACAWFFVRRLDYSFKYFSFIFLMIIAVFPVGARVLNIVLNYPFYLSHHAEIFNLALKGFSVIGGVIASLTVCLIIHKMSRRKITPFLDALSIPFILSFTIMKLGCFANGCCFGKPTSSFLGLEFPTRGKSQIVQLLSIFNRFAGIPKSVYPTQLFEAIITLLFLPFIYVLKKHFIIKNSGQLFLVTCLYFITLRLIVHPLRSFPYPSYVVTFIYPISYLILIGISIYLLKNLDRFNEF